MNRALCMVVFAAHSAHAEPPVVSTAEPQPAPIEPWPKAHTRPRDATDTRGAPRPGSESGRIDPGEPSDTATRMIARGALYLPKMLFELALLPIRGAVYLEDRYQLSALYDKMFYHYDHTIGLVPVATWETGFGLTIGARMFVLDTFGEAERLVLQATTGGGYRIGLLAGLDSGTRFGRVRVEIGGNFDRRPADPFYGIGNEGTLQETGSNIDALTNPTAVRTHFRYEEARALAAVDVMILPRLHAFGRAAAVMLQYSPSEDEPSVQDVYQPQSVVGFGETTSHFYGEAELVWDSRRRESLWDPPTLNSAGSLARAFGGLSHRLDDMQDFWHYGFELQHYTRVGYGPRVLVARLHGEAVSGALDQVPITELPLLGGSAFLRGYPYARFRDRIAMVGSLQYMWSLMSYASAFVFTDVGRVYRNWSDVGPWDLHVGYGIGIELYGKRSFLADLAIASSSNGGIAITAEFSPVLDARGRWR